MSQASWTAEILAVGTELLMGETTNTNAVYLSQELAGLGVDVYYHTTVGDNPGRLKDAIQRACGRANLVLFTGGLGPTDDDLTIVTIADAFGVPLIRDKASEEGIQKFFIARGMPMSPTNLKQADRPEAADVIPNAMGTAPGICWDVTEPVDALGWRHPGMTGTVLIMTFPGVPREMKSMWADFAVPKIQSLLPQQSVLVKRSLKFFGIGESMLAEKLRDLMAQSSPTVSPYVGNAEVRTRIAAKAATVEEAEALIAPVEAEIMKRVGEYCFGHDEVTLEQAVGDLLIQHGKMLATAESCTGGLLSSRLTDVGGSSAYILMNVVTYSNMAKEQLLKVSPKTIMDFGAVSGQTAAEMAMGVLALSGTDIGVSVTGIAGPGGGSEDKPVGTAYIGIAQRGQACPIVKRVTVNAHYSRDYIKLWFSQYALNYVRLALLGLLDADE